MADDDRVQINIRMPRDLRDRIDERRKVTGLSREEWFRKMAEHVLAKPLVKR